MPFELKSAGATY
jgi:hypothetical protein